MGIDNEKVTTITTPLLGNDKFGDDLQLIMAHIADIAHLQGVIKMGPGRDPNWRISSIYTGCSRGG